MRKEVSRDYLIVLGMIGLTLELDRSKPAILGEALREELSRGSEQDVYTWLDWAGCRMMARKLSDLMDPLET
jgi:hypothetical protein